jgi:hypothetical protein
MFKRSINSKFKIHSIDWEGKYSTDIESSIQTVSYAKVAGILSLLYLQVQEYQSTALEEIMTFALNKDTVWLKNPKERPEKKDCQCIKALFYLHACNVKLGNPNIALAMSINDHPVYMARYAANVLILKSPIGKLAMFFFAFCGIQGH